MRRQSKSLQVSILFAYFLFLLAGVSFDNMQKIKNGTCIVSACYDEKQMRENKNLSGIKRIFRDCRRREIRLESAIIFMMKRGGLILLKVMEN